MLIAINLLLFLINYSIINFLGNAKQPSILSHMITEAHEIREKQSANRAHVINNVAIKGQNNADDSVRNDFFIRKKDININRKIICLL